MRTTISEDKKYIQIENCNNYEYSQLKESYTLYVKNYRYSPKYKKKLWDGKISFIRGRYIPFYTYKYLMSICEKYGIDWENYKCSQDFIYDNICDPTQEHGGRKGFNDWCKEFFKDTKWKPRDYQIKTAYDIIRHKHCLAQLATSAGKTLISFIVFAYLLDVLKVKKIIMVVPTVGLVNQSCSDFTEYNSDRLPINIQQLYAGVKFQENTNLVIGTYQSLSKMGEDFYNDCECLFVDECHRAIDAVTLKILDKLRDSEFVFGMSGTIPSTKYAEGLTLQSYFGPIVSNIKAKELQDEGYISECKIIQLQLDYLSTMQHIELQNAAVSLRSRKKGKDMFTIERNLICENEKRLDFIIRFLKSINKNTLLLFHRVEYGKMIFDRVKQETTGKQIFYIDGNTPVDARESIRELCEKNNNVILIASFGTCSTGISINNLYNLLMVESFKAPAVIIQSIGRLLRKNVEIGKTNATIYDLVDYLYSGSYLQLHAKERYKLYKEEGFPVEIQKFKI